jgi:hypothetical protein
VWFAQPAQIPTGAVPDVSALVATFTVRHAQPTVTAFAALDRMRGDGGWLEGVLLVADASGHLDDRVAWFVRDGPADKVPSRTVLFGRVSDAERAAVVEVLAAVVAWGDWTAPDGSRQSPGMPTGRHGGNCARAAPESRRRLAACPTSSSSMPAGARRRVTDPGKSPVTGRTKTHMQRDFTCPCPSLFGILTALGA